MERAETEGEAKREGQGKEEGQKVRAMVRGREEERSERQRSTVRKKREKVRGHPLAHLSLKSSPLGSQLVKLLYNAMEPEFAS